MNALLTTDTFGVPGIVVDARSWQFLASGVSEVRQREPWSLLGYSPLRCLQEIWIAPDLFPYPSRLYNLISSPRNLKFSIAKRYVYTC
jgi:hypothetical protein